jgi:signal transduction histidine kinase
MAADVETSDRPIYRSRRLGLRARTALAFGLTALVLAAALSTLAYTLVRRSLLEDRRSTAMRQAYTDARLVRTGLRSADPDVADLLSGLQVGPANEVLLMRGGEWYTGSAAADPERLPAPLRRGVLDGRAGRQIYLDADAARLAVGVPLPAFDAAFFEVTSLEDITRTLDVLGRSLAVAGTLAALAAGAVGATASGRVLRPLRRMAGTARRIVLGELDTRLDAEGDRDLVPLVSAFNEMLDELRERIQREARFASDVTHELRGPLAALASAVDVVNRRRDQLPEGAVIAVDALAEQVEAFNQLVLDLLEISRFDAGAAQLDRAELDLVAFVRAVLADRHQAVAVYADGDVPQVAVDRRRLHQVVTNLLDNAGKYGGGAVAVVVSSRGEGVRMAVDDAGPGIAASEREAVFERFQRGAAAGTPDAPRGSGLGLALVSEHVALHGGRVWVEERPGGGARVMVELPRCG